MDEETTLVGVRQLTERWDLSKQAIYNLINSGEIQAVDLNEELRRTGERTRAQWRIPMAEVYRWERAQADRAARL